MIRKSLGCVFLLFITLTGYAQVSWRADINKALTHSVTTAQVGVMIMDAKTGKSLYELDAFKYFTPASTLKLFTGAAALRYLGPGYRFHTTIAFNPAELKGSTLQGNLYVKFSGDPSLKVKHLQQLIMQLQGKGIKNIAGNVIIDDTRFQRPYYAPGWTNDSMFWSYAAPISSVILDENQFSFKLVPSKTLGHLVKIEPKRNMQYMQLQSHVRTVTYAQSMHDCSLILNIDQRNKLTLSGCWPQSGGGWQLMSVANPTLMATRIIQKTLKQANIHMNGRVIVGVQSPRAKVILDHPSKSLLHLLGHMLKASDNVYAGSITKTLGSMYSGRGTFLQGVKTIKQVLGPMTGIDFHQTVLSDGSGQSRYDLMSPYQMTQLLHAVYQDKKLKKDFTRALAISGRDGTLKYRLGTKEMLGKVTAKTGSLKGVSTLAGYVKTHRGKDLIFAIMINGIVTKLRPARALEDQICTILYRS